MKRTWTPCRGARAGLPFGVIVLAAGASRRLGRPKALLARAGAAVVRHQVVRARAAGAVWIGVALGYASPRIALALKGLPVQRIHAHRWRYGMGDSLAAAARAAPAGLRLVVVATDQWRLQARDLRNLGHTGARRIRAAAYGGVLGIPATFPAHARAALTRLRGDRGARRLLRGAEAEPMQRAAFDLDTIVDRAQLDRDWPRYRRTPR